MDDSEQPVLPYAYATLITSLSYLPGAILLAHSLKKQKCSYPLILMYTELDPDPKIHAEIELILREEGVLSNFILRSVDKLQISEGSGVAARFRDTWTKLQVFALESDIWKKICFLDADILALKNLDDIFKVDLGGEGNGEAGKRIAASHVCVCNLDKDDWAPEDWNEKNCAHTGLKHPQALTQPTKVPREPILQDSEKDEEIEKTDESKGIVRTHTLLNSGVFVFAPSDSTYQDMFKFARENKEALDQYQFPDQDFLTEWWRNRWVPVGWQWNALKTWRYWHPEMWRDSEVRALHYIVDKPWNARLSKEGQDSSPSKGSYRGKDRVTHGWWWDVFEEWESERRANRQMEILELVGKFVAPPLEST